MIIYIYIILYRYIANCVYFLSRVIGFTGFKLPNVPAGRVQAESKIGVQMVAPPVDPHARMVPGPCWNVANVASGRKQWQNP